MKKLMLMIVIGLFLLTAAGADQPDLIGGEWTLTTHISHGELRPPRSEDPLYAFILSFQENGTGSSTPGDPFLWNWISDDTFRYATNQYTSQITISRIGDDEYLFYQTDIMDSAITTGQWSSVGTFIKVQ